MFDEKSHSLKMDKSIEAFSKELSSLRTGRANAAMLDIVRVDVYGQQMPINQIGSITTPEPRMINVQVWDQNNVPLVDAAIKKSELGLNPQIDGQLIRLPVPELNEERRNELKKLIHPNSVIPLKIGENVVDSEISDSVWGFVSVYLFALFFGILLILSTGLSLETAFSTIFSCLNNLGPALGEATNNYASLNDASKIILSFTMILGRLEIYTLLVLFTTFFWRY